MATSKTAIANLALSHLGIGKQISNLDTDRSQEANACRQFYDQVRDEVLGDFKWPFATRFLSPSLVQENPTTEWAFSYRYPAGGLRVIRILSGSRTDTRETRVPYRIVSDDSGGLIYTDMVSAVIEYTISDDNPEHYTPDFVMAFSLMLAAFIAPQITAGDPFKIRQSCMQMYEKKITEAQVDSTNEEQPDIEPDSEFILARGGVGDFGRRRYNWPL